MALTPGTRFGPYEIVAPIGKGGMGEVYRATDTNLKRSVATKVLPEAVAGDAERLARFQREAELLASLNHPNIAAIYGLERSEGTTALVMELVEGPTLADRIARGPIPVDEALLVAKQIAEALEAAHEQGIIHRDLKPANVKVRDDGTVKVLDFGLAKALEPVGVASSPEDTHSPTLTSPALSQVGVILGTAAYMSPELARGKPVDRRADVWAFGAVLYEMLTGQRAFAGEDMTDTLAAVVRAEPSWDALPAGLSPTLRMVLARCLQKDARQRFHHIADVRLALEGAFETSAAPGGAEPASGNRARLLLTSAVAVAALVSGVLAGRAWLPDPPAGPAQGLTRFTVDLDPGQHLSGSYEIEERPWGRQRPSRRSFALSRDGRQLVFVASDGTTARLYHRPMDQSETRPLPGTEGASSPFFAPDGETIAFFVGSELRRVSMESGEVRAVTLSGPTANTWFSGSWTDRDTIVLGSRDAVGVYEVPSKGGPLVRLTAELPRGHRALYPDLLPGNRALMFNMITGGVPSEWDVVVESLDTGQRRVVVEGGSDPRYVSSGHILFVRNGTLMAVPFDVTRLEVAGPPLVVLEDVMQAERGDTGTLNTGAGQFAVSRSGALAYARGGVYPLNLSSLVWVDSTGAPEPLPLPSGVYTQPRFSPDGTHLAYLEGVRGDRQVWVYDIELETPIRLTLTGADITAVWSPDGTRLAINLERDGRIQMFSMPADGSEGPQLLAESEKSQRVADWSSDGVLAFLQEDDIWTLPMDGDGVPEPFRETDFQEAWPAFSPDGRWLAYGSNETGRWEVYVRPFPDGAPAHRVSTAGGGAPLWSANGQKLFYRTLPLVEGRRFQELMVADVTTDGPFTRSEPRALFESQEFDGSSPLRAYDLSPDGQRFVMAATQPEPQPVTRIHVVLNWFEELNERVPVN